MYGFADDRGNGAFGVSTIYYRRFVGYEGLRDMRDPKGYSWHTECQGDLSECG